MQQSVQKHGAAEQPVEPASVVDPAFMAFRTVGAAISALLFPHAEVAIHDLRTDRIVAIWNAFSRREVGDPSLLGDIADQLDAAAVFGPYDKADATGGRLKSVSAVLAGPRGERIGLLCINFDVSKLDQALTAVQSFMAVSQRRPPLLFQDDYREAINIALRDFLSARSLSLNAITRPERIKLVAELDRRGLFEQRKAAEHIAVALSVSRATVYALLAASRAPGDVR